MKVLLLILAIIGLLFIIGKLAQPGIERGCNGFKDYDINCAR